jgi:hypothetical protein
VRQTGDLPQRQRRRRAGIGQEPGNCFGDDAVLLRPRPPLDQHFQVQLARGQAFQRILADGAEPVFVDATQQPVLPSSLSGARHGLAPKRNGADP